MSNFKFRDHYINYEIYGKGYPLVILNGIMMSTNSWHQFLEELTKHNQVILVDFVDQGQSDDFKGESYSYEFQTELLKELFIFLKIDQVNIASISYGGQIALDFASKYPSMVNKLVLFNTTAHVSEWMKETYDLWLAGIRTKNGLVYYKASIPTIYSQTFFKDKLAWMKERESILLPLFNDEKFLSRQERLILSTYDLDIIDKLDKVSAKTLIVASMEDSLTPIKMQEDIHKMIKNSEYILIPNAGHASMYEKPKLFTSLILGFINV